MDFLKLYMLQENAGEDFVISNNMYDQCPELKNIYDLYNDELNKINYIFDKSNIINKNTIKEIFSIYINQRIETHSYIIFLDKLLNKFDDQILENKILKEKLSNIIEKFILNNKL